MMDKVQGYFGKGINLRTKLLVLFLALTLLPLSLQGVMSYSHFSQTLDRKTEQFTIDMVRQINTNLNRMLKDFERLSLLPLYDQTVLDILREYDGPMGSGTWAKSNDYLKMKLYTSAQAYDRPEIRGIHLLSNSGILFSNLDSLTVKPVWDGSRESWFAELRDTEGKWRLLPPHVPGYDVGEREAEYITVGRELRDPGTLRRLGYILIDIRPEAFGQLLSNLNFEQKASLMIVDSQQRLMFERASTEGLYAYKLLLSDGKNLPNNTENQKVELDGQSYLHVRHVSGYSGLSVISLTPIAVIQKESREMLTFTMGLALLCMAAVATLAVLISYRVTRPLIRLKHHMIRVERGDFSQRVAHYSNDELGQISRGFNRMMEEIHRLFHEVYLLQIQEREAELSALQSQINPHFIYNTLESINMMAIRERHAEVSVMVTALGKLLRYTIGQADRMVTLREELAFVDAYVRIQQVRYNGKLKIIYDMEEEVNDCMVPKLILQPLVENAICHGIEGQQTGGEEGGIIWVSAVLFDQELLISVRDNGKGMEQDELDRLNASVSGQVMEQSQPSNPILHRHAGDSLGLHNIAQRLRLIYGEDSGLSVDGSAGQGLVVTLSIHLHSKGA
ncbi:sensor histidine kinase [Paenibacillus barcinonensis]|uniref:Sensor histidine kinase n=1 Tax=Paenibacillus barcinonensis TaxID=198119 RepID=A0A2V4VMA9_PAEBA|nr:sensor histidine kinase [Paenibacillus barcinonensis]PYE47291.1 two-component system sensor histidine kinase YesM [Paenibacillus barcinonensis]QKS58197.1 sensor histidine kinase [Paenibacillus barcinonensis]